jgi:glycosyltransferase involved in cell wall biosynthesis
MSKKKLFILSTFSGPLDGILNNRFVYLANYLSEEFEVDLITTNFYHSKKEEIKVPKIFSNFKLTIFDVPSYNSNISIKRLWSHFRFALKVRVYFKKNTTLDSVVYCAFPPISVAVLAYAATKDRKRFVLDIQDLWPEVFYSSLKFRFANIFFLPHLLMVKYLASKVQNLVAVSKTYEDHFIKHGFDGDNKSVVYIGVDNDQLDLIQSTRDSSLHERRNEEVKFIYAGTLGHSYNLNHFIRCFAIAQAQVPSKRLVLTILGTGPLETNLKKLSDELPVEINFKGRVTYQEVMQELLVSDVAVNSIAPGMQQSIINKHGDYTLMGLPILSTQDNREFRDLVDEHRIGINIDPENEEELIQGIKLLAIDRKMRNEMARNSKIVGQKYFNRTQSYRAIKEFINAI